MIDYFKRLFRFAVANPVPVAILVLFVFPNSLIIFYPNPIVLTLIVSLTLSCLAVGVLYELHKKKLSKLEEAIENDSEYSIYVNSVLVGHIQKSQFLTIELLSLTNAEVWMSWFSWFLSSVLSIINFALKLLLTLFVVLSMAFVFNIEGVLSDFIANTLQIAKDQNINELIPLISEKIKNLFLPLFALSLVLAIPFFLIFGSKFNGNPKLNFISKELRLHACCAATGDVVCIPSPISFITQGNKNENQ